MEFTCVTNATRVSLAQRLPEGPSEVVVDPSGDATTTLFPEATRNGRHPIGILTSTVDTFINHGTTTEYMTQHLGTYISEQYAKVESTSRQEYFRIQPTAPVNEVQPTGLVSSSTSYEVHGRQTTEHSIYHYRSYIDGHYAQLVSSISKVYSDPPFISATPVYNPNGNVQLGSPDKHGEYKFPGEQIRPSKPSDENIVTRTIGAKLSKPLKLNDLLKKEKKNGDLESELELTENAIRARSIDVSEIVIKPDQVEKKESLPTFTVSEDGELKIPEPSIEVHTIENEIEPTAAHRFDHPTKATKSSLDSVTYIGFVDFTTTIDDTVVMFRPKKTFSTKNGNKILIPKINPTRSISFVPSSSFAIPTIESSHTELPETYRTTPVEAPTPSSLLDAKATSSSINPLKSLLDRNASKRKLFPINRGTGNRPKVTLRPSALPGLSGLSVRPSKRVPGSLISSSKPPLNVDELRGSIDPESDVELVYKTLYTTYTYFTTFFRASTTRVKSREEIISNIVTLTNILDPTDLASLRSSCEVDSTCQFASSSEVPAYTSGFIGRPNSREAFTEQSQAEGAIRETPDTDEELDEDINGILRTFYTTYTYFTTLFVDGTSSISTRTEIYSNIKSSGVPISILSPESVSILATSSKAIEIESTSSPANPRRLEYSSIHRDVALNSELTTPKDLEDEQDQEAVESTTQGSFIVIGITTEAEVTESTSAIAPSSPQEEEDNDEEDEQSSSNPTEDPVPNTTASSGEDGEQDEVTTESQSSDENIDVVSATPAMKTFYTTFTYFTTLFRNGTSFVTSNLETVTNTADATIAPTAVQPSVTFFTTFTYWTTSIDGDNTMIKSSEETRTDVLPASVTDQISIEPSDSQSNIRFSQRPEIVAGISPSAVEDLSIQATATPDLESSVESEVTTTVPITTDTPILESSQGSFEDLDDDFTLSSSVDSTTKGRTFTPVIRPNLFRARTRGNGRPRGSTTTTVAIITRSDVTPTLIATPAEIQATPTFPLSSSRFRSSSFAGRGSARFAASSRGASPIRSSGVSSVINPTPTEIEDPAKPTIISNLRLRRPSPFRQRLKERQRLQLKKLREESNDDNAEPIAESVKAQEEEKASSPSVPVPRFPSGLPGRTPIFISSRTEKFARKPKVVADIQEQEVGEQNEAPKEEEDEETEVNGNLRSSPFGSNDRLRVQRERSRSRINSLFKRRRPSFLRPRPNLSTEKEQDPEVDDPLQVQESRRRKRQASTYAEFGARTRVRQPTSSRRAPIRARQEPEFFDHLNNPPFTAFSGSSNQPNPSSPKSYDNAYDNSFHSSFERESDSTRSSNNVRRQVSQDDSPTLSRSRSRSRFNPNQGRTLLRTRPSVQSTTEPPTSAPRTTTLRRSRFRPRTLASSSRNQNRFSSDTTSSRGTSNRFPVSPFRRPTSPPKTSLFDYDYDYDYDSTTELQSSKNSVPDAITVTHQVPLQTVIPVRENGETAYRDILTTSPSLEVIAATALKSTNIDGSPVIYANAITNQPVPGTKVITFEALRATETTAVVFTPTRIRGLRTSFSHIVPSTIYNIQPVTTEIIQPVDQNQLLSKLLLQLLGGQSIKSGLSPLANPLLQGLPAALGGAPAAPASVPPTQFITHTSTYVTTVTNTQSTVLGITLRGREIKTTLVDSMTEVVTATEYSTETRIAPTSAAAFGATQAPEIDTPPPPPEPQTSVVTKFVSGKTPGDFTILTSTVTIDPNESERRKRDIAAVQPSRVERVRLTLAPNAVLAPEPLIEASVKRSTANSGSNATDLDPSPIVKTEYSTFTYFVTSVVEDSTVTKTDIVVSSNIVTEAGIPEATPLLNIEIQPSSSPISDFATKTYFTTSTYYTTLIDRSTTITKTRTKVESTIVTETFGDENPGQISPTRTVLAPSLIPGVNELKYLSLGPNIYGQIRTLYNTYTYFTTDAVGEVRESKEVITQISTSLFSTSRLPEYITLDSSLGNAPESGAIFPDKNKLSSIKEAFQSTIAPSMGLSLPNTDNDIQNVNDFASSVNLEAQFLNSLKESFASSLSSLSVTPTRPFTDLNLPTDGPEILTLPNSGQTTPGSVSPSQTLSTQLSSSGSSAGGVPGNTAPDEPPTNHGSSQEHGSQEPGAVPDDNNHSVTPGGNDSGNASGNHGNNDVGATSGGQSISGGSEVSNQGIDPSPSSPSTTTPGNGESDGTSSGGVIDAVVGGLGEVFGGATPNVNLGPVLDAVATLLRGPIRSAIANRRSELSKKSDIVQPTRVEGRIKPTANLPAFARIPGGEPNFIPVGGAGRLKPSRPNYEFIPLQQRDVNGPVPLPLRSGPDQASPRIDIDYSDSDDLSYSGSTDEPIVTVPKDIVPGLPMTYPSQVGVQGDAVKRGDYVYIGDDYVTASSVGSNLDINGPYLGPPPRNQRPQSSRPRPPRQPSFGPPRNNPSKYPPRGPPPNRPPPPRPLKSPSRGPPRRPPLPIKRPSGLLLPRPPLSSTPSFKSQYDRKDTTPTEFIRPDFRVTTPRTKPNNFLRPRPVIARPNSAENPSSIEVPTSPIRTPQAPIGPRPSSFENPPSPIGTRPNPIKTQPKPADGRPNIVGSRPIANGGRPNPPPAAINPPSEFTPIDNPSDGPPGSQALHIELEPSTVNRPSTKYDSGQVRNPLKARQPQDSSRAPDNVENTNDKDRENEAIVKKDDIKSSVTEIEPSFLATPQGPTSSDSSVPVTKGIFVKPQRGSSNIDYQGWYTEGDSLPPAPTASTSSPYIEYIISEKEAPKTTTYANEWAAVNKVTDTINSNDPFSQAKRPAINTNFDREWTVRDSIINPTRPDGNNLKPSQTSTSSYSNSWGSFVVKTDLVPETPPLFIESEDPVTEAELAPDSEKLNPNQRPSYQTPPPRLVEDPKTDLPEAIANEFNTEDPTENPFSSENTNLLPPISFDPEFEGEEYTDILVDYEYKDEQGNNQDGTPNANDPEIDPTLNDESRNDTYENGDSSHEDDDTNDLNVNDGTGSFPLNGERYPDQPDEGKPSELDERNPVQLDERNPVQLDERNPVQLDERNPVQLDERNPVQLDERNPVQLDERNPVQLGERNPIPFGEGTPVQRGERNPVLLGERDPTQLGERDQTQLGERNPVQLGERNPTQLGERNPTQIGERNPTQLGERNPIQLGERNPTQIGERNPPPFGERSPIQLGDRNPAPFDERNPVRPSVDPFKNPGLQSPPPTPFGPQPRPPFIRNPRPPFPQNNQIPYDHRGPLPQSPFPPHLPPQIPFKPQRPRPRPNDPFLGQGQGSFNTLGDGNNLIAKIPLTPFNSDEPESGQGFVPGFVDDPTGNQANSYGDFNGAFDGQDSEGPIKGSVENVDISQPDGPPTRPIGKNEEPDYDYIESDQEISSSIDSVEGSTDPLPPGVEPDTGTFINIGPSGRVSSTPAQSIVKPSLIRPTLSRPIIRPTSIDTPNVIDKNIFVARPSNRPSIFPPRVTPGIATITRTTKPKVTESSQNESDLKKPLIKDPSAPLEKELETKKKEEEEEETFKLAGSPYLPSIGQKPGNSFKPDKIIDNDDGIKRKEILGNNIDGAIVESIPGKALSAEDSDPETTCQNTCGKNEICQIYSHEIRCKCRPGFGRSSPGKSCEKSRSYQLEVLTKSESEEILVIRMSPQAVQQAVEDTVKREIKDSYHGSEIMSIKIGNQTKREVLFFGGEKNLTKDESMAIQIVVHIADDGRIITDKRLQSILEDPIKDTKLPLGADVTVSRVSVQDFDECSSDDHNDCSDQAQCLNQKGSYTCACKDGYHDLSGSDTLPGRVCSATTTECDLCNRNGECIIRGQDVTCECRDWFAGRNCQINLKLLLIVGCVSVALMIFIACGVSCFCCRDRQKNMIPTPYGTSTVSRIPPSVRSHGLMMDPHGTLKSSRGGMVQKHKPKKSSMTSSNNFIPRPGMKKQGSNAGSHSSAGGMKPAGSWQSGLAPGDMRMHPNPALVIPRARVSKSPGRFSFHSDDEDLMVPMETNRAMSERTSLSSRHRRKSVPSFASGFSHGGPGSVGGASRRSSNRAGSVDPLLAGDGSYSDDSHGGGRNIHRSVSRGDLDRADAQSVARSYNETIIRPVTRPLHTPAATSYRSNRSHATSEDGRTMAERDGGSSFVVSPTHQLYRLHDSDGSLDSL
ncbi:hypothetical protein TCAL_13171 [Tigriopus californicus]|uniref:EGF-like domain-containing protein n=1 Tax=Tigriopus californicus TaxID=6832 RepID=A0A553NUZ1_TIGCA|nr:hypothetical protein TCAL_13171 [Tigriopus californicus]